MEKSGQSAFDVRLLQRAIRLTVRGDAGLLRDIGKFQASFIQVQRVVRVIAAEEQIG